MPRTRAALRSQALPDGLDIAATVPLPATPPVARRAPLGEVSGNQGSVPVPVDNPEDILKAHKGPGKGKKGQSSKKSTYEVQNVNNEGSEKVLPDENENEASSAVEDACQDLLNEQSQGMSQVVVHEDRPSTPPSLAVTAATEQLSSANSALAAPTGGYPVDQDTAQHEVIPVKQPDSIKNTDMSPETQAEDACAVKQKNTSSKGNVSSEQIKTKASMRPEDSIEAIDKFEEEIEKVRDLIPAVGKSKQSMQERKKSSFIIKSHPSSKNSTTPKSRDALVSKPTDPTLNHKVTAVTKEAPAVVDPNSQAISEDTRKISNTRKVSDSSDSSENRVTTAGKIRVSSVHKAPFVPAKSTKAPTRASFELPGEVVARKLKEAREERLKCDETANNQPKKPAFKARPVRLSQAPVVKPTATSRARISMARGEALPASSVMQEAVPKSKLTSRPSGVSAVNTSKRLSTLSVIERSAAPSANISARVNRGPSTTVLHSTKQPQIRLSTQANRQSIAAADATQSKAKGKEVFNRGRIEQDELEKIKKGKEEAAKKARAEAAERGRIASREWAEKQRRKMEGKKGGAGVGAMVGA
ncbi:MAG: hypothetical protein Q9209_000030 [Squamulea sp. 1 TL-2023]